MKKKISALIIAVCLVAAICAFAGCDTGGGAEHTHTYAAGWSCDETSHWHAATCEHTDEVSGKEQHSFTDGICTVCGYKNGAGDDESNVHKVTIGDQPSYVFTASSSVMELTGSTTVQDYLNVLKDNGEITFEGYEGNYGYYITSVNGTEERTISSTPTSYEGYSWNIYIDFIQLEGDDVYYGSDYSTCDYDGTTLYLANYGVSGLPCVEGHVYALVYVHNNMSW